MINYFYSILLVTAIFFFNSSLVVARTQQIATADQFYQYDFSDIETDNALVWSDEIDGDSLASLYPDWRFLESHNQKEHLFLSLFKLKAKAGLESFSQKKIHLAEGLAELTKNTHVLSSNQIDPQHLRIQLKKKIKIFSVQSWVDYFFAYSHSQLVNQFLNNEQMQERVNEFQNLIKPAVNPEQVTYQKIRLFSRFFNYSDVYCHYGQDVLNNSTNISCLLVSSMKKSSYRWISKFVNPLNNFRGEILYTIEKILETL